MVYEKNLLKIKILKDDTYFGTIQDSNGDTY